MVKQTTESRALSERRDALVQRQRTAEAAAREATVEAAKADEQSRELKSLDESLVLASNTARDSGNEAQAEELWERHLRVSTDAELARERATSRFAEAKEHESEAKTFAEPIAEVDNDVKAFNAALDAAETEVDKLDQKAKLFEQAQAKLAEGDHNPDAQGEAQALLEQAAGISIDEEKIDALTDGGWARPTLEDEPTTPMTLPDDDPPPTRRPEPPRPIKDDPLPSDAETEAKGADAAADAAALRDEASDARAAMQARVEERLKEVGLTRDQTAREQWAADQTAKASDMQVQREQREAVEARTTAERLNKEAKAAADRGDQERAESLREDADSAAMDQRVRESRLASAQAQAKEQGDLAASLKQDVKALEVTYDELHQSRRAAESALDNLEERARLLDQAKQKFAEAEQKNSSRALREAEELVHRAETLQVDRDAVREILPDFPAETPGLDDTGLVFEVPDGLDGRIASLTTETTTARDQLVAAAGTRGVDDLREVDRLRLERAAADEAAETVELRRKVVTEAQTRIAEQESEAQAAEAKGDTAAAIELREGARVNTAILEQRRQLLAEAESAEAALRPRAEEIQRRLDELNAAKDTDEKAWDTAEAELDKIEQQTALLDQARAKFTEASRTRDPVTLRAAQDLLREADTITVDRGLVRAYLPDFDADAASPEPAPPPPAPAAEADTVQEPATFDDIVGDGALADLDSAQPAVESEGEMEVVGTDDSQGEVEFANAATSTVGDEFAALDAAYDGVESWFDEPAPMVAFDEPLDSGFESVGIDTHVEPAAEPVDTSSAADDFFTT